MENKDIGYLRSIDYASELTRENRFYEQTGELQYHPFVLEGFYPDIDEAEEILKEIDPDLYIVGDSNGGIEISRKSFWK